MYNDGPTTKNKALWMSKEISTKMKKKHKAWYRYRRTHMTDDYNHYAKARNQVRIATRKVIKTLSKTRKPSGATLISKTQTKKNICNLEMTPGGILSESDTEKAEALNTFFSSVFTKEDSIPTLQPRKYKGKITGLNFTVYDVAKI